MDEAEEGIDILGDEIVQFLSSCPSSTTNCQIYVESGTGTTAMYLHRYFAQRRNHIDIHRKGIYSEVEDSNDDNMLDNDNNFPDVKVMAVSCVIPPAQLKTNMEKIGGNSASVIYEGYPHVLFAERGSVPSCDASAQDTKKLVPFGTPCTEHLTIWSDLKTRCGITFDLLYAPKAFEQIFEHWNINIDNTNEMTQEDGTCNSRDQVKESTTTTYIYLHCGGVEGNISQLNRYRYLNLINPMNHT
jgi:hypothetical protein